MQILDLVTTIQRRSRRLTNCDNLIIYWSAKLFLEFPNTVFKLEYGLEIFEPILPDHLLCGQEEKEKSLARLYQIIRDKFEELERNAWNISPTFLENLLAVKELMRISELEMQFLAFGVLVERNGNFSHFLSQVINRAGINFETLCCVLFDVTPEEFQQKIASSPIMESGLMIVDFGTSLSFSFSFPNDFDRQLFYIHKNKLSVFKSCFVAAKEAQLSLKNFEHIREAELALKLLEKAIKTREKGANLLFYGPPGVGKSELARILAKMVAENAYEICTHDENEIYDELDRLRSFCLSQYMLKNNERTILIFDEVENILSLQVNYSQKESFRANELKFNKAWMNQILERNEIPTIWICNDIDRIDPAYLRRFCLIIPFGRLPKDVRSKIVRDNFVIFDVSDEWIERVSDSEDIPPALIAQAAHAICLLGTDKVEDTAEMIINNSLKALGLRPIKKKKPKRAEMPYLPQILNIDPPAQDMFDMVTKLGAGKFLFYGPPGTGKTALAKEIAKRLNKRFLHKRLSDLLSPYVGDTEYRIAELFEQASREEAIVLIDEIDGLIFARSGASHFWEVSITNEFLTQIEEFEGIFIGSSNLLEKLDPAAMRRFDFKIEFKYLEPEQAWQLLKAIFGNDVPDRYYAQIARLKLTPGNFATVYRKFSHKADLSLEEFVNALKRETEFVSVPESTHIGFV